MILRVISISLLLFISSDYISCQEFDFLHLKDKNRTSIERAGDLFQIAIPIAGLAYTYYSDDVVGRAKAYESIVKGKSLPPASIPESFNVLMHELKGLGLDIRLEE